MIKRSALCLLLLVSGAQAQTILGDPNVLQLESDNNNGVIQLDNDGDIGVFSLDPSANSETFKIGPQTVTSSLRRQVSSSDKAILKGLDKVSGLAKDLEAKNGEPLVFGSLSVQMSDCRYPVGDPNSDAFVHVVIMDPKLSDPVFDGWMVASSPALNALDHARYDIWAVRCQTDIRARDPQVVSGEKSPRPLMRP